MLVGAATADDAGVYKIDPQRALVQTVDFFTPIVDDPFLYGKIAATNSLSDVYAMGGRPLTAMNILGFPSDKIPPEIVHRIIRGGAAQAVKANCLVLGGHTIQSEEPFYGMSVTGLVDPRRLITNARARPGDWLILTKPLGTGIITTGIKRGIATTRAAAAAVRSMTKLNDVGATLAEKGLVKAGTDVTGYGLLGHLGSMCRASKVGAQLEASALPLLHPEVMKLVEQGCVPGGTRENLATAQTITTFENCSEAWKILAADAQTSGGLLLCLAPENYQRVSALLRSNRALATVIGRIVKVSGILLRG